MSTKWAYTSRHGIGKISHIYCAANPTDNNPGGVWVITIRGTGKQLLLENIKDNQLFYYEDKNAYQQATQNAKEIARAYYAKKNDPECCTIM